MDNKEIEQKSYEELWKEQHMLYGFKYIFKTQPDELKTVKEAKTDKDKFVKYLEETSPFQFLWDFSKTVEPPLKELEIVENTMRNFFLPPGVINCIIHYVFMSTDGKFTKNYFETICSHHARLDIKKVPDCMAKLKAQKEANQKNYNKQPPLTKGQETIIERLMLRVEQLEARVEELEKQLKK